MRLLALMAFLMAAVSFAVAQEQEAQSEEDKLIEAVDCIYETLIMLDDLDMNDHEKAENASQSCRWIARKRSRQTCDSMSDLTVKHYCTTMIYDEQRDELEVNALHVLHLRKLKSKETPEPEGPGAGN